MRRSKMLACGIVLASVGSFAYSQAPSGSGAVLYEGGRLIVGDGSTPIENGAFVVQNGHISAVGPKGAVTAPARAARVDLTGKTVMPTMVDLHGHFGFQNIPEGTMSKETFTRENLIDHMQRLAYHRHGTALIFARTETNTWHDWVWPFASGILFVRGRLTFHHVDGRRSGYNAGAPSTLIAYGRADAERLADCAIPGHYIDLPEAAR